MIERDVSYKRYDSYKTMMMKKMTKSRKKKKENFNTKCFRIFHITIYVHDQIFISTLKKKQERFRNTFINY